MRHLKNIYVKDCGLFLLNVDVSNQSYGRSDGHFDFYLEDVGGKFM